MIINFRQELLTHSDNCYARKVLRITEKVEHGFIPSTCKIADSIYYCLDNVDADRCCDSISCNDNDYFILYDCIKGDGKSPTINIYYLVVIDSSVFCGFRIVDCICRAYGFDTYPYAENIFCKKMIESYGFVLKEGRK